MFPYQPSVYITVVSVPTIALCVAFMIAGVFPWFMSIFLAPATYYVLRKVCNPCLLSVSQLLMSYSLTQVVTDELLQRDAIKDSLDKSPYFFGLTFGTALWVAYAWATRLRYGAFQVPSNSTVMQY